MADLKDKAIGKTKRSPAKFSAMAFWQKKEERHEEKDAEAGPLERLRKLT